jgi:hypothetical protein
LGVCYRLSGLERVCRKSIINQEAKNFKWLSGFWASPMVNQSRQRSGSIFDHR